MRIHANGKDITDLDEWFVAAPPKGRGDHWKDYRSAKEVARAWCRTGGEPEVPQELQDLLASHQLTKDADLAGTDITPELRVRIDDFSGEHRNTDLAITCSAPALTPHSRLRRLAISVEAKADEAFGQRVSAAVKSSAALRLAGKASNGDRRVRALLKAVLGGSLEGEPNLGKIRYQLLTATAGALSYACEQHADAAVLVVHEFSHAGEVHTKRARLDSNAQALGDFLSRLTHGAATALPPGQLVGPFLLPGNAFIPADMPLLIGKAVRVLQ